MWQHGTTWKHNASKWNKKDKYYIISLICSILKSWTYRVDWWLSGAGGNGEILVKEYKVSVII